MADSTVTRRWTTRALLHWMGGYLGDRDVESPRVCAELLLAHVLRCERMRLYMETDRPASPDELATLRDLVARCGRHEPVQYLTGEAWFFTHRFAVNESTLIPRPATETLVEHVLQTCRTRGMAAPRILDLGTGTGCIAVSLLIALPEARAVATDVAPEALELARRNATDHGVIDRLELREGDLWEALDGSDGPFDLLCSNPPYISDVEWSAVPTNVAAFEPASALRGGVDGLDVVRPLLEGAMERLAPAGMLAVELAESHTDLARLHAEKNSGIQEIRILRDHEGLNRVLVGVAPGSPGSDRETDRTVDDPAG